MIPLEAHLLNLFGTDHDTVGQILSCFDTEHFAKGDYLVKQDEQCRKMSFITSGYFQIYAIIEGREITQWVSSAEYFVTEISSFLFDTPSRWNIQALTDFSVESIGKTRYEALTQEIPECEGSKIAF